MATHEAQWRQIKSLLNQNISLIPVRDKGDKVKVPFAGWKEYQSRIIEEGELFSAMETYHTSAVAMICGKVSDNMEVIDVDVKHWPGIMVLLAAEFKALMPELVTKLRIHKTPSGGFHLIYRVSDGVIPGNKKLCYGQDEDGNIKKEAAIETRGEGGYVLMPPSLNYSIISDVPIPTITWDERCSLINICQSFSKKVDVVKPKLPKIDNSYYTESPWEHFRYSDEAATVLPWKVLKDTSNFIYFTRPDKSNGVSASFNKTTRIYYIFTSSTQYEPSKGYFPGTILSIEQFGGDNKATYAALVQKGYGKIRSDREKRQAERLARSGQPPLPNFSEEAKTIHTTLTEQLSQQYPYGTFWNYDEEGIPSISRENLQTISAELGFCLYHKSLRFKEGQLLKVSDERFFIDTLKQYIKEEEADVYEAIANVYEAFMERHLAYTLTRLPIVSDLDVMKDGKSHAYKFYTNTVVHITKDGYNLMDYTTVTNYILAEKMLNRPFNDSYGEGGRYTQYLNLAIGLSDQLARTIGYLAHDYRDASQGWIVVLTESCADSREGGGAGKSAFCEMLKPITGVLVKNAVQFTYDERSFGSWNGERIFVIADAPKEFRYDWLKESATGTLTVRKMHKDAVDIPTENAPKFLVNTNYSFVSSDGGMDRRVIPVEFTNFFNRTRSIDGHFGIYFPTGFSESDWNDYDNYMINAIRLFLSGEKLTPPSLSEGGKEKQLRQKHGNTAYDFIMENIIAWRERGKVPMHEIKEGLQEYCNENSITMNYRPTMQRVGQCIRDIDKEVLVNVNAKFNGFQKKCYKWPSQEFHEEEGGELPY